MHERTCTKKRQNDRSQWFDGGILLKVVGLEEVAGASTRARHRELDGA